LPTPDSWTNASSYAYAHNISLDALLGGEKWGPSQLGQRIALTYSFATASSSWSSDPDLGYGPGGEPSNQFAPLSDAQKAAVRSALQTWSAVANVTFTEVAETATVVGDLRFGFSGLYAAGAHAWAYLPDDAPAAGDVWLASTDPFTDLAPGSYDYMTLVHEIGHALGLKHPFDSDGGNGAVLAASFDSREYTVMSYSAYGGASLVGWSFEPTTPMLYDIAAIQYLYGANHSFRSGNDTYVFTSGQTYFQTIWDGGGNDTIRYDSQTDSALIDLRGGSLRSSLGLSVVADDGQRTNDHTVTIADGVVIENAIGGGGGDALVGNEADNDLRGLGGNDNLLGEGGDDVLRGGPGRDTLSGGGGGDTLWAYPDTVWTSGRLAGLARTLDTFDGGHLQFGSSDDGFWLDDLARYSASVGLIDGGDGNDFIGWKGTYTPSLWFSRVNGAAGNDTLAGGGAHDRFYGGIGADLLTGGDGRDTLDGGPGADTLRGGAGVDNYFVDDPLDVVDARDGLDIVRASIDYTLPNGAKELVLTGAQALKGTGNGAGNILQGNDANNELDGLGGRDLLDGGRGYDLMRGGPGDDTYVVDSLGDGIIEYRGEGRDTVLSAVDWVLGDDTEDLVLTTPGGIGGMAGTGNDLANSITGNWVNNVLDGGIGADTLIGGEANDTLTGGRGDDRLVGGNELDSLTGGPGSDSFVYDPFPLAGFYGHRDTITDFQLGVDKILLDAQSFSALVEGPGALSADHFTGGSNPIILYDAGTGALSYDRDGTGPGGPEIFATLSNHAAVTAADFEIIG
jgi:serralysin